MSDEKLVRIPGETLVIKLSPDETSYRAKYLPDTTKLTDEKLVCTVCSTNLAIDIHKGKDIFVHRVLNVLVCELCYNFYGDGNFSVDEDGDDKYCRWCGQGGTLYLCSTCSCAFCQKCVKQNLKSSVIAELEKDDWKCYICNPRPLFGTRTICWGAQQLNKKGKEKERERLRKLEEKKKEENERKSRKASTDEETSKKKRKRSVDSDSTSPEVMPSKKPRRNSKASQNGFRKGRRRRKSSSSDESSEDDEVRKHSRSRTSSKKKNISYAESSCDEKSESIQKNKKKIKKKKHRDTSDESSDGKKSKTNRKSTKNTGESSDDSSDEEKSKHKKSIIKKKLRDDSDLSSDEKRKRKKSLKIKKESSSDDSSEDKKIKSEKRLKKMKNYSSEEDSESTKKSKKLQKGDRKSKSTLESDSDTKKTKMKGDESTREAISNNSSTDSQTEDKIMKKRIKLAVVWLSNAAKDIAELGNLISVRAEKFKQKKINSDNLKTYEDVIKTVNKVKQLITGVHSNYEHIEKNLEAQLKPWKILTGVEETEPKTLVDGNYREVEETSSKSNSQSAQEQSSKELNNDATTKPVKDTESPQPVKENQKSKDSENQVEDVELQWSGDDDSDNEKQNATKDLISKANETLDKMEEEENPKINKPQTEKKSKDKPPNADKSLDKVEEIDALSKEKLEKVDNVLHSTDSPIKESSNETDEVEDIDALSKEKLEKVDNVLHSTDSPIKESSNETDEKKNKRSDKKVTKDAINCSNKETRLRTPDLNKKADPKSHRKNVEKKEVPKTILESSGDKSQSATEEESDSDKELFSKKNSGKKVLKKKSQKRRSGRKKVTRKSVTEKNESTEKSASSELGDLGTDSASSECSSLKKFGDKIKDKWNSSEPPEDMKLIAPLGSDLSEEELETNDKSASKRKGKDSSEESDTLKGSTASESKIKSLSTKKQKTSNALNEDKLKKESKREKQGQSVSNKEEEKESNKNKSITKEKVNTTLSSESEGESKRNTRNKVQLNNKKTNESVKKVVRTSSKTTLNSDSDKSDCERIDNHNKKKKKVVNHKKSKVEAKQTLSSESDEEIETKASRRKSDKSTTKEKDSTLVTNGKKGGKKEASGSTEKKKKDHKKNEEKSSPKTYEDSEDISLEKSKEESDNENVIESGAENESISKKFVSLGSSSEDEKTNVKEVKSDGKKKTENKVALKNVSKKLPKNCLLLDSSDEDEGAAVKPNNLSSEEDDGEAENPNNVPILLQSSDEEPVVKNKGKSKSSDASGSIENLSSAESSDEEIFRKKKSKKKRSKSSDSDFEEEKAAKNKKKRKLVRCASSSNNSDGSDDGEGGKKGKKGSEKSPGKGRKNIKKIKKDVADSTKEAAEEEKERRKRIEDRQKLFNQVFEVKETETLDKLVLDFDAENKKELLSVDTDLVAKMKPHQARGVKFMWDSCFESISDCKKKKGSGCILAHCMGLGKTFQVISLVHTLLMNEATHVRTIMVVCPLSTVLNWYNEFDKWLDNIEGGSSIDVYHLTKLKNNPERARELRHWQNTGGVLIMGYEMFRNLTAETAKKFRPKMKKDFQETLVDPGADVIVCDEGHMLKNEQTALSKAMGRVRTLRRIVLTGTPMQNNLVEYHCMVQFVKPNLLGTKKEFLNRFVNPITNGQFVDSTERDVSVMKRRAHVLHKMLEGLVQRFDYNVLTPFLPPKHEYVVSVCLSELQVKMYQHYLDNYSQRSDKEKAGSRLFQDWQALGRIWTHPRVVKMSSDKAAIKKAMMEESDDEEGSLKDFIDDSEEETTPDSGSESAGSSGGSIRSFTKKRKVVQTRRKTRSNATNDAHLESEEEENAEKELEENAEKENTGAWWSEFLKPEDLDDIRHSGKLMLLFGILKESEMIEDKVLVFSQSLFSLDLIEYFLDKIDAATQEDRLDESLGNHQGTWSKGLDYFRLDGSTSSENRNLWTKSFNREDNPRARLFLISTRAGGLGINLTAANRVIIFDASWNPSHDVQSIFRVYRFGQKKPCYVYRFIASGTMEEKVYDRQVAKQSISNRVVDEQQVHRHFTSSDLNELYSFTPPSKPEDRPIPTLPKDVLMAELLAQFKDWIEKYHEHDSLLENVAEEELNEEERKLAWEDYETEKKRGVLPNYANNAQGQVNNNMHMQIEIMRQNLKTKFPEMPEAELNQLLIQQVSLLMRHQHMLQQQQKMAQQQYQQQQMAAKVQQMRHQQQQAQLQMKQMYQKVPPGVLNQQAGVQPSLLSSFLSMPSRSNVQMPGMSAPYPQMTPNFKEMEKMRQRYLAPKTSGVVITELTDEDPKPSSS